MAEVVVIQAEEDIAVAILDTNVGAGFVGADRLPSEGWSDAVEAVEDLADGAAYTNAEEDVYPEQFGADGVTATADTGQGVFERSARLFVELDSGEITGDCSD